MCVCQIQGPPRAYLTANYCSPRSSFAGAQNLKTMDDRKDDRRIFPCNQRSHNFYYDYERLNFVLRASGLSHLDFIRHIGCDFNTFMKVRHGLLLFDIELVRRIHARYPQIDLEWLLCGPAIRL